MKLIAILNIKRAMQILFMLATTIILWQLLTIIVLSLLTMNNGFSYWGIQSLSIWLSVIALVIAIGIVRLSSHFLSIGNYRNFRVMTEMIFDLVIIGMIFYILQTFVAECAGLTFCDFVSPKSIGEIGVGPVLPWLSVTSIILTVSANRALFHFGRLKNMKRALIQFFATIMLWLVITWLFLNYFMEYVFFGGGYYYFTLYSAFNIGAMAFILLITIVITTIMFRYFYKKKQENNDSVSEKPIPKERMG